MEGLQRGLGLMDKFYDSPKHRYSEFCSCQFCKMERKTEKRNLAKYRRRDEKRVVKQEIENMEAINGINEEDTEYTANIICPYCGYVDPDSWEYGEESGEGDCPDCGKAFYLIIEHTRMYTARRIEDE